MLMKFFLFLQKHLYVCIYIHAILALFPSFIFIIIIVMKENFVIAKYHDFLMSHKLWSECSEFFNHYYNFIIRNSLFKNMFWAR